MWDVALEALKVVILGIVEGVTEFLPISSTGHLIIATELVQLRESLAVTFEIFIQFGAVIAVIWYFRSDFMTQFRTFQSDQQVLRLWLNVILAFIPTGLIAFFLADIVQERLFNPIVVGIALVVGGIVFLIIERIGIAEQANTTSLMTVKPMQAIAVGFIQAIALIPGVSRSGASIIGGMGFGMDRETATKFSFYLAIPTLLIATVYELITAWDTLQPTDLLYLLLGTVVSGIVAWFAIRWLLRYVANNSFVPFGYYRIGIGILVLVLGVNAWL